MGNQLLSEDGRSADADGLSSLRDEAADASSPKASIPSAVPHLAELGITVEQEANLRKLAAYLMTLPADYPDFEMASYVTGNGAGAGRNVAHKPVCGTAACAAGHGPAAGIDPLDGEIWSAYAQRAFAPDNWEYHDETSWDWCFAAGWSKVDNTAHGAARRIQWMLEHGIPDNAGDQRWGDSPLCYTDIQVSA